MFQNAEFLQQYKELETAIRLVHGDTTTVYMFESSLKSDDATKLRLCRLIRNYWQHNSDGESFIQTTGEMCRFLQKLTAGLLSQIEKGVGECVYRLKPLTLNMTFRQVFRLFVNADRQSLPVVNEKNIPLGMLHRDDVFALAATAKSDDATLGSVLKKTDLAKLKAQSVITNDLAMIYDKMFSSRTGEPLDIIFTKSGKYMGVLVV